MRKAYIESFIILLFLSCCPFIVSSCHEEEKEEISDSPFDEEDIQHEQDLNAYLGKTYSCKISQVSAMESSVRIYNPQNEMFATFQTKRYFIQNETSSKK